VATEAFLNNGYLGTTMDVIAAAAHVSKQTLYKEFADKEALFGAIVATTVDEVGDSVLDEVGDLGESADVEADLLEVARRQLTMVLQTRLIRLRRLVIGEASRFPELGRMFYERGQARSLAALATAFERLGARGALRVDDPALAAAHFNWLVMSAPVNQAMLLGDDAPTHEDLERHAAGGVRAFLAAYGTGATPAGAAPPASPSASGARRRAGSRSRREP
jgi:AcrR family transcriptional regulator